MALSDIPMRDDLSGIAQADLFKSYIKDSSLSDTIVEALLTAQNAVDAWRMHTNAPSESVPFSYDLTEVPMSYVTKIRMMSGDIDDTALYFTDVELTAYLEFLPLKYLIMVIKAFIANSSTYPDVSNSPIRIMRDLLDDASFQAYDDRTLINMMLKGCQNPYEAVVGMIQSDGSIEAAHDARQYGGGIASLDGISFSKETVESGQLTSKTNISLILEKMRHSEYVRGNGLYEAWNGTTSSNTLLKGGWYAL